MGTGRVRCRCAEEGDDEDFPGGFPITVEIPGKSSAEKIDEFEGPFRSSPPVAISPDPIRRATWLTYADTDSYAGEDVFVISDDLSTEHCRDVSDAQESSGYTVWNGKAYFRTPEIEWTRLTRRRRHVPKATLHVRVPFVVEELDWDLINNTDSLRGRDAMVLEDYDSIWECQLICMHHGYSGFVLYDGNCYFKKETLGQIEYDKYPEMGAQLCIWHCRPEYWEKHHRDVESFENVIEELEERKQARGGFSSPKDIRAAQEYFFQHIINKRNVWEEDTTDIFDAELDDLEIEADWDPGDFVNTGNRDEFPDPDPAPIIPEPLEPSEGPRNPRRGRGGRRGGRVQGGRGASSDATGRGKDNAGQVEGGGRRIDDESTENGDGRSDRRKSKRVGPNLGNQINRLMDPDYLRGDFDGF